MVLGVCATQDAQAFKKKHTTHAGAQKNRATSVHNASKKKKTVLAKHITKSKGKKGKKATSHSKHGAYSNHNESSSPSQANIAQTVGSNENVSAPLQMIAQNKEKSRIADSVNKSFITNLNNPDEEGYFASLFSNQKKSASFQTMEGTAAVFKSVSGWQDKKFYILTNQLPVGTLVRITTADLKSICAKVINALPEMGNAVQYRLNDAAAAILGITNKTFQISVTY
jgi:hypothetical protein